MKLIEYRNLPLSLALVLVTCLTLSVPPCGPAAEGAKNGEKPDGAGMRASEWGTFTTLHWPNGRGLEWYQSIGGKSSELPSFINGDLIFKVARPYLARMETPVIYFYTDEKMKVDISVDYQDGRITEFYPGFAPGFRQWKQLELIPSMEAQAASLEEKFPVDPKRPDNHYYQARAVPEAAVVRMSQPADHKGESKPDQFERFVFYRGAGHYNSGLRVDMNSAETISLGNTNANYGIKHLWVLQSSKEEVRWKKVPALPAYDPSGREMSECHLKDLEAGSSRQDSITRLKASMTSALKESGLSHDEAEAMVATWDEQWYEEPGQRVFSISPKAYIDQLLPLTISPKPAELTRVFVHRAEILSPQTIANLESAMSSGVELEQAARAVSQENLGRFAYGAIESVARDIGDRIAAEHRNRGLGALRAIEAGALDAATERAESGIDPVSETRHTAVGGL